MKTRAFATLLMSTLLLAAVPASAAFIDGEINFSGPATATGGSGLGDATGLSFGAGIEVDSAIGDFAGLEGSAVTFSDFQFSPVLNPDPVDPLWSVGGFSFALADVTIDLQNSNALFLSGTGTISGGAFDPTAGTWFLTGGSAGVLFNFSSGSLAQPPVGASEPATLLLIGLGVVGLAGARRRKTK